MDWEIEHEQTNFVTHDFPGGDAVLFSTGLLAQDDEANESIARSRTRVSLLNGDVSVRRGDTGEVVAAAVNAPLMSQDRVLTSSNSRAEVQFDHSNMVTPGRQHRVAAERYPAGPLCSGAGYGTGELSRPAGFARDGRGMDTPSVSVRPARPGIYRVAVREDGTTEVTVRSGEAEIYSPKGTQTLSAGSTMLVRGSSSDRISDNCRDPARRLGPLERGPGSSTATVT